MCVCRHICIDREHESENGNETKGKYTYSSLPISSLKQRDERTNTVLHAATIVSCELRGANALVPVREKERECVRVRLTICSSLRMIFFVCVGIGVCMLRGIVQISYYYVVAAGAATSADRTYIHRHTHTNERYISTNSSILIFGCCWPFVRTFFLFFQCCCYCSASSGSDSDVSLTLSKALRTKKNDNITFLKATMYGIQNTASNSNRFKEIPVFNARI